MYTDFHAFAKFSTLKCLIRENWANSDSTPHFILLQTFTPPPTTTTFYEKGKTVSYFSHEIKYA